MHLFNRFSFILVYYSKFCAKLIVADYNDIGGIRYE